MAIDGANISRGMGRGAAQVYDTSGPVNMYARLMQQQQLRRVAEQKLLTDELSKINPNGIREADIPEFTSKYQEAKDIFAFKSNAKNQKERIDYGLEYDKKLQELKLIVNDSKNIGKGEQGFTNILLTDKREIFTPDAVEKFQKSKTLSRNDPNFIRDYTVFEHQVDASNTMKELADINKRLLLPIKSVVEQDPDRVGNINGTFLRDIKRVPIEEQALAYGMAMDVSPKLKAGIYKLFPKNEDETYVDYKARTLPLLVAQMPAVEFSQSRFTPNRQEMTEYQRRRLALAEAEGSGESINKNIIVTPKTFIGTRLPQKSTVTGKPILDINKKQVREGEGITANFVAYSTVNPPSFQMPQLTQAFNIDKAINEPINTEDAVNLTGIGYVKTKGGGTGLKATIKVKGDEHIINLADLPVDIRTDEKYYLPVLRAVENEYKRLQQSRSKTKPTAQSNKSYSATQEKLISENLKANPAYTREEIIKALGL